MSFGFQVKWAIPPHRHSTLEALRQVAPQTGVMVAPAVVFGTCVGLGETGGTTASATVLCTAISIATALAGRERQD